MLDQLVEAWQIHNKKNTLLLDASNEYLIAQASSKGRNIGAQFAHMHNVRLAWLKQAKHNLPAKIAKDSYLNAEELKIAFIESGIVVEKVLRQSIESGKNLAYFKPSIVAFVSYLISHESHHRGQIVLALKQSGHALDKKISYELWNWSK